MITKTTRAQNKQLVNHQVEEGWTVCQFIIQKKNKQKHDLFLWLSLTQAWVFQCPNVNQSAANG